MSRFLFTALMSYFLFCSLSVVAVEESVDRYALVIGNSNYQGSPLANSINDARDIAASLAKTGFKVTSVFDTDLKDLKRVVETFYAGVPREEGQVLALVYYAGHAIQINHTNYLVPLGLEFGNNEEFLAGLYDISRLFSLVSKHPGMQNIIILDACRNNPFEGLGGTDKPAMTDGLAPIRAPVGTLIAYATEPNGVASDGSGKNGIYTKHLLKHIRKKIAVEEVFKKVRRGVARETGNKQIPWEHSSLLDGVYINPPRNREVPELMVF